MEDIERLLREHDISLYGSSDTINSLALLYHENSKLTEYGMRALGERISLFSDSYVIKRAAQPFKFYPDSERFELKGLALDSVVQEANLREVLFHRKSVRAYDHRYEMSRDALATLLYYSYGRTAWREMTVEEERVLRGRRNVPSAGGLYPLEMYVVALHCGMSSGLYHYQVRDNALERLRQGDSTQLLLEMIQAEPYVDLAAGSVVLFITGCVERQMIKYGERAYRFMQNEVGSVTQMVTLIAEALELGSCILGGYNDDGLNDFLQVDGVFESVQSVMVVGKER